MAYLGVRQHQTARDLERHSQVPTTGILCFKNWCHGTTCKVWCPNKETETAKLQGSGSDTLPQCQGCCNLVAYRSSVPGWGLPIQLWRDNPPAKPPEVVTHLRDLNTGDAFLKSHEKMITKPNKVLVACPMYIDRTSTGHPVQSPAHYLFED